MAVIKWIELVCSECSESLLGLVFPENYNAITLRQEAKARGWKHERQDGLNFDVCAKCQGKTAN